MIVVAVAVVALLFVSRNRFESEAELESVLESPHRFFARQQLGVLKATQHMLPVAH